MTIIHLLRALLPRDAQISAADRYDVVAAVGRGIVDGFVLAHERDGDGGCEAAEGSRVRGEVYGVPGAGVG